MRPSSTDQAAFLGELGVEQAWRGEAACRGMGDEAFVIASSNRGLSKAARVKVEVAKAICAPCPVRADCLAFAVRLGETGGVWGGEYLSLRRLAALRRAEGEDAA